MFYMFNFNSFVFFIGFSILDYGFVKSLIFFSFFQKKFNIFFLGRWVMGFRCFTDGVVGFGLHD